MEKEKKVRQYRSNQGRSPHQQNEANYMVMAVAMLRNGSRIIRNANI